MTTSKRNLNETVMNKVGFELLAPRNQDVKLIGSWDGWQTIDMQRHDDGIWRVEVDLADGDYEYKFQTCSESDHCKGKMIDVAEPKAIQFSADADTSDNAILKIREGKQSIT